MKSPFLSIITINYNNAKGLQKTIESIVNQTFTDYEYIVIDGASTDESVSLIKDFSENIDYWVSEQDKGIYHAMNKGIKKAKGHYLQFLNSGDMFTSASAIKDFVAHPNFAGDIIYGDYKFTNGNSKIYPDARDLSPYYFMKTSLPHQSTFFKKNVFEKVGGYDESYKIAADRAFFLRAFLKNEFVFRRIPYTLVLFDLSGVSNNAEHKKLKEQEDTKMFKENFGIFYQDMLRIQQLKKEVSRLNSVTLKGYLKRIAAKIKNVFNK